jgi:hypothetical protein
MMVNLRQLNNSGSAARRNRPPEEAEMSLMLGLGMCALALPLTTANSTPPIAVTYSGNNGSLPPPYHRATEIEIDAAGQGSFRRRHGYDRTDPQARFEMEFTLTADQVQAFSQRVEALGAMKTRWREQARPPVGGSVFNLRLIQGDRIVKVPAFPVASQAELAARVRAEVLALVPVEVQALRVQWEQTRPAE